VRGTAKTSRCVPFFPYWSLVAGGVGRWKAGCIFHRFRWSVGVGGGAFGVVGAPESSTTDRYGLCSATDRSARRQTLLPKHPDQLTDEDLDAWISSLVDQQAAEGPILDYRQTLNLSTPGEKRELAKDVTSFANELSGTLVYGVPESQINSASAPVPGRPYGMESLPGLPEAIENTLFRLFRRCCRRSVCVRFPFPSIRGKRVTSSGPQRVGRGPTWFTDMETADITDGVSTGRL